jgi:hypothetical protein
MSIYAHLIWVGICVLALGAGIAYERHEGAKACIARDVKAAGAQETKVTAQESAAAEEVKREGEVHDQTVAEPVIPIAPVRVCPLAQPSHPSRVLQTTAAGSGAAESPDVPAAAARHSDAVDVGEPLERVGQSADAQISGLVDYINHVCLNH